MTKHENESKPRCEVRGGRSDGESQKFRVMTKEACVSPKTDVFVSVWPIDRDVQKVSNEVYRRKGDCKRN